MVRELQLDTLPKVIKCRSISLVEYATVFGDVIADPIDCIWYRDNTIKHPFFGEVCSVWLLECRILPFLPASGSARAFTHLQ
jgi:hypothetical protein